MLSAKPQILINLLTKCIIPRITFNQHGHRWDFCLITEGHIPVYLITIDNLISKFNNLNKRLKHGTICIHMKTYKIIKLKVGDIKK